MEANQEKLGGDSFPSSFEKPLEDCERIKFVLNTNKIFEKLNTEQLQLVADAMRPIAKSDGEIIIRQGDPGDNFYILNTGAADVFITQNDGEMRKLMTYEEGSNAAFGELAMLCNAPRQATVIAVGDVQLWAHI